LDFEIPILELCSLLKVLILVAQDWQGAPFSFSLINMQIPYSLSSVAVFSMILTGNILSSFLHFPQQYFNKNVQFLSHSC